MVDSSIVKVKNVKIILLVLDGIDRVRDDEVYLLVLMVEGNL